MILPSSVIVFLHPAMFKRVIDDGMISHNEDIAAESNEHHAILSEFNLQKKKKRNNFLSSHGFTLPDNVQIFFLCNTLSTS